MHAIIVKPPCVFILTFEEGNTDGFYKHSFAKDSSDLIGHLLHADLVKNITVARCIFLRLVREKRLTLVDLVWGSCWVHLFLYLLAFPQLLFH